MKAVSHHTKRDEKTDCCHTFNQSTHDLSQNIGKLRRRDATLRSDLPPESQDRMPERSCDPRPPPRSFGGKVQEHLPTDVYGILQSCEFIIHGARFSEEKHTGRWRTGNWPERLRCTKSGEIVIMLLTLDRHVQRWHTGSHPGKCTRGFKRRSSPQVNVARYR